MRSRTLRIMGAGVTSLALATSLAGTASATTDAPVPVGHAAAGSVVNAPDAVKACASNTGTPNGDGVTAQDFESDFDIYDSEAAADFKTKKKCKVTSVDIFGVAAGAAEAATIWIYKDDGGLPGKEKCTASVDGAGPDFTVPVSGCKLKKKTNYWLGAQVSMDFATGGQWFWAATNDIEKSIDAWRNPGGGFGTSCTDWGYLDSCLGFTYDVLYSVNKGKP